MSKLLSNGQLRVLPVRVLIADGDRWKLQAVLEIHADVDVFRIREKVRHFMSNQIREETTGDEQDHQPHNSIEHTRRTTMLIRRRTLCD